MTADDGIDYAWVMQTTFILAVVVGAPVMALLSVFVSLGGWRSWVSFAVRVGAGVWLATAVSVYLYARSHSAT